MAFFPLKSTVFPTVKSFAHNLIHKRCAEPALRRSMQNSAAETASIAQISLRSGSTGQFRLFASRLHEHCTACLIFAQ
jgi:hypothetical protein